MDIYSVETDDIEVIEYKVRKLEIFQVTRFVKTKNGQSGSHSLGKFDAWDHAYKCGHALADQERMLRGLALDDERIQFPKETDGFAGDAE